MDERHAEPDLTWIILGAVLGFFILMVILVAVLVFWQRHSNNFRAFLIGIPFCRPCLVNPRDSLTDLGSSENQEGLSYSQRMANWRRSKIEKSSGTMVVGVKVDDEPPLGRTPPSGYRWKKKWRDRKIRSKVKRKLKHEERKKRREARKVKEEEASEVSSDDEDSD